MSHMSNAPTGRPAAIENLEARLLYSNSQMAALALALGGRSGEAEFTALLHYAQRFAVHTVTAHGTVNHPKPVAHPKPVISPKPVVHTTPVAKPKPVVAKPKPAPVTSTTHVPATGSSSPSTITTGTLHNVPVTPTTLNVQAVTGALNTPSGPVPWTRDGVLQNIQPMQHSTAGRLPLFVWGLPTGYGPGLIQQRQSGQLKQWIDQLAARGMVPIVDMGQDAPSAVALAQTLQDDHQPVFLLFQKPDILESTVFQHATVWSPGIDIDGVTAKNWPSYPQADASLGAAWVRQQLQPFQQAGVHLSGVWFDDERSPYPWWPAWQAEKADPRNQALYPAGVLNDWYKWNQYVDQLRSTLINQAMVDPIHQMFPGTVVGNFGETPSSAQTPFVDEVGSPAEPHSIGTTDAAMPVYYVGGIPAAQYLKTGQVLTQATSDGVYFQNVISSMDSLVPNAAGKLVVPYASAMMPGAPYPISTATYKEMLRHLWLRGANSMFLFGLAYPGAEVDQAPALQQIEAARSVYDEMLTYRPFLDQGTPMNLANPSVTGTTPTWSGLKLGNQALVRTYSVDGQGTQVTVNAFGQNLVLDAPRAGATYLITQGGAVTRVA
jgi:hypothetical protein